MKKIGITGQEGFVGKHLYNTLSLQPQDFELVPYDISFFDDAEKLENFVSQCDVIVHLAAMNRHSDPQVIYDTNISLVKKLIQALEKSKAHVLFSSSSQEERDNLYGKSKKEGRELLADWAKKSGGTFTGLVIPNVFGPFGKPNYNSFIATFCHKLTHGETPVIDVDGEVKLIYVGELVDEIIEQLTFGKGNKCYEVPHTVTKKVSEVLQKLVVFKEKYLEKGEIPELTAAFDINLFNTYRSYINLKKHFPVKFTQHTDNRGAFVEVIRLGIGGQCSFSTTVPGITRGNHFHTRKIERFAVIKGKATIELRKIDSDEVITYHLDGNEPAYVDMPIWFTHNITNTGDEDLYTIFWINEPYDAQNPDTYFVEV
ncbi:MAG: NAD-dependent epimerase/dehydratase family protein [Capnocytophaga sp.]|nr:NAD-dependent epimerase/dehydratase family protein [Capnocytophaga sp.]